MSLMRAAIVAAMMLATSPMPVLAGDYAPQKVVYHNNGSSEPHYFRQLLGNVKNHLDAVGDDNISLVVIGNGGGIDLLQQANADPEISTRIDALRARGARFLVCANTLKARDIGVDALYGATEADVVPSGVAEIARLEQQGYVYIHP